jgi:hypothetical protein
MSIVVVTEEFQPETSHGELASPVPSMMLHSEYAF